MRFSLMDWRFSSLVIITLPMIFADFALARRLERPEAVGGARFVEARRRLSPDTAAEWIEVAGAYAMFDGPASPVTQTFGLGLFARRS
jgi:hypothetical protein